MDGATVVAGAVAAGAGVAAGAEGATALADAPGGAISEFGLAGASPAFGKADVSAGVGLEAAGDTCVAGGVPAAVVCAPALGTAIVIAASAAEVRSKDVRRKTVVSINSAPSKRNAAPREFRQTLNVNLGEVRTQHGDFMPSRL